jgi:hypothetical protein
MMTKTSTFCNALILKDGTGAEFDARFACYLAWRATALVFAALCLALTLCPMPVGAESYWESNIQRDFDYVDTVVMTRKISASEKMEVLRYWKSEVPKEIKVYRTVPMIGDLPIIWSSCPDLVAHDGIFLLYLNRKLGDSELPERSGIEEGEDVFWCAASFHKSKNEFDIRIELLNRTQKCDCKKRDPESLYDQADAVANVLVMRVTGWGENEVADVWVDQSWKAELPKAISVRTGDASGCGYPIFASLGFTSDCTNQRSRYCGYPVVKGLSLHYLLYLRRDASGEYSTHFCSGNVPSIEGHLFSNRRRWLDDHKAQKSAE